MKTIFAISFIASVYVSPVIAVLTVILALFAMSIIAEFLTARNAKDTALDKHYTELKDAFDDIFDETTSLCSDDAPTDAVHNEQHADIWHTTEATTCDFACQVSFPVQPVLALPAPADTISNVVTTKPINATSVAADTILVDYTTFTYRELQAKCKALRNKKNNIKLTAKKSVLIKWLQANAPAS